MRTSGTLEMAGMQPAGVARIGGGCPASAIHVTARPNHDFVWSIVGYATKQALPVFSTDRPDRRQWELSP